MELVIFLGLFFGWMWLGYFLLVICLDERCPAPSEMKLSRRIVLYGLFTIHVVLALAVLSF